MKTQYYTASSLDGFLATEDDSIDWLFPLARVDDTSYPEFIAQVGALAMGSATYRWMVGHAAEVIAATGSPWPYTQPTWVFSHRPPDPLPGADLRFVQGDVRPVHQAMRRAAGGRNLWIVGGGDLAGQFHDAGLLDEVIVQLGSVTLGRGKPLFPRRLAEPWVLTSARPLGTGMAELRYRVRPARRTGTDAVPEALRPFWDDFLAARGGDVDPGRFVEAFAFGDTPAMADALAALVVDGAKRATTSARWCYEAEGQPLPAPGDLSIVTDGAGLPRCVIRTTQVDVVPFDRVDADFAAAEGEGDRSLAAWRDDHRAFFTRECLAAGRAFDESMPVVCVRFEVLHPTPEGASHGDPDPSPR